MKRIWQVALWLAAIVGVVPVMRVLGLGDFDSLMTGLYLWIVFCEWVRNGFKVGLEFWLSVLSPLLLLVLFVVFTLLGLCSGGVIAIANVILPILGIYFVLPIPNWHPLGNSVTEMRGTGR